MKRFALLAVAAVAVAASGCSQHGTVSDQQSYGPPPVNYKQIARDYLRRNLFDPYSVRDAEIAAPMVKHSFELANLSPGWMICVRYNAKNRMGAYIGIIENALMVRGDKISASSYEQSGGVSAAGFCGDARYEPFTELMAAR